MTDPTCIKLVNITLSWNWRHTFAYGPPEQSRDIRARIANVRLPLPLTFSLPALLYLLPFIASHYYLGKPDNYAATKW